jgi:hypothetical protein
MHSSVRSAAGSRIPLICHLSYLGGSMGKMASRCRVTCSTNADCAPAQACLSMTKIPD